MGQGSDFIGWLCIGSCFDGGRDEKERGRQEVEVEMLIR